MSTQKGRKEKFHRKSLVKVFRIFFSENGKFRFLRIVAVFLKNKLLTGEARKNERKKEAFQVSR